VSTFHDGEVITFVDWALIRRLHAGEGLPKAQIARQLGISRNTVREGEGEGDRVGVAAVVLAACGGDGLRLGGGSRPGAAG
jgi:hypothetical protein